MPFLTGLKVRLKLKNGIPDFKVDDWHLYIHRIDLFIYYLLEKVS